MANKRAKTLDDSQLAKLLHHIDENSILPERDKLIVLLSFKAGLRVAEIAKIDLVAMLDAEGKIAKTINVFSDVGKKRRERSIPMHPLLRKAIGDFRLAFPTATYPAISSQPFRYILTRGGPIPVNPRLRRMSVTALTNYYWRLLAEAGFEGTSSHSGRRTFGTKLAREANLHHCSLRDVQRLMGHARLDTTERYVEFSEDAFDLISAI
jgi:integrase/recombinase XerD